MKCGLTGGRTQREYNVFLTDAYKPKSMFAYHIINGGKPNLACSNSGRKNYYTNIVHINEVPIKYDNLWPV